ncbi:3-hydroxybenzoate 6-hydroxylase 1 OS=Pseudomonas alcaligenes GN=xlnD PE=1 SV=1 [Rhizoctonia solani AG-1 IB]|uniref:3-hydroxybenzoate 6-hydroxylase 1 n=1 Tax=Thanatephorus cucumeris (strain AG1-IB / isolate 7/3/14) TaxID=1108050 RepID=A0A0B7F8E1_THACB|nr:3-hydroxybenzoate 6-hydroxylase 1 OS=Pseudomonas alcaligenes GN=xlnD PE=1 SV=1 [Rhizoctonia solani AG-1 IB]
MTASSLSGDARHTHNLNNGRTPSIRLNVVVVGCGLGGLACAFSLHKAGHNVVILETARNIGEIGAGIQVTPNLSRILIKWGLRDRLDKLAVVPQAIVFRRYKNGEKVGGSVWGSKMEHDHGSPYYHVHRADLHRMLYELVDQTGVKVRLASTVKSINPSAPSVTLFNGETIHCDLLIGADGVKSMIREVVVGGPDRPRPTGDAAYRAIIPAEKMRGDPELEALLETPEMTAWMGPGRHIMAYCIRNREEYNMVLIHPDGRDGSAPAVESWTAEGSVEEMRRDFNGWEPRIQKLIHLIPSTLKWLLADREPLEKWVHDSGKVVLLGDSCHPMLPYRAQGAAMAVEDAVVLGGLLSGIRELVDLPRLLRAYQALRLPRTAETQKSARLNQFIFHLPDGPEQIARDEDMRIAMQWEQDLLSRQGSRNGSSSKEERSWAGNMNQWADRTKNKHQFEYDAFAVVEEWWEQNS